MGKIAGFGLHLISRIIVPKIILCGIGIKRIPPPPSRMGRIPHRPVKMAPCAAAIGPPPMRGPIIQGSDRSSGPIFAFAIPQVLPVVIPSTKSLLGYIRHKFVRLIADFPTMRVTPPLPHIYRPVLSGVVSLSKIDGVDNALIRRSVNSPRLFRGAMYGSESGRTPTQRYRDFAQRRNLSDHIPR